jgi:hypothetical protein
MLFEQPAWKKGMMVKETNIEAKTLMMTAIGKLRIKSPEPSGKKTKGINAMIKVMVHPTTDKPICFVPKRVASIRLWPSLIQRSIFSTTTMLSSPIDPKQPPNLRCSID